MENKRPELPESYINKSIDTEIEVSMEDFLDDLSNENLIKIHEWIEYTIFEDVFYQVSYLLDEFKKWVKKHGGKRNGISI